MSYTPGPWTDESPDESQWGVYDAHGQSIGQAHQIKPMKDDPYQTERTANARLMAAAPELLAALKAYDAWADKTICKDPELKAIRDQMRAAIAKAEGTTP